MIQHPTGFIRTPHRKAYNDVPLAKHFHIESPSVSTFLYIKTQVKWQWLLITTIYHEVVSVTEILTWRPAGAYGTSILVSLESVLAVEHAHDGTTPPFLHPARHHAGTLAREPVPVAAASAVDELLARARPLVIEPTWHVGLA